jgi:hypothetical protein
MEGTQTVTPLSHVLNVEHAPQVPCARHPRIPTVSIVTNLPYPVSSLHWTHSILGPDPSLDTKYCDLTDLATRRIYLIFSKDRSAPELCRAFNEFFNRHPEFRRDGDALTRFVRCDPEPSYRSAEFISGYSAKRPWVTLSKEPHATSTLEGSQNALSD